MSDRVNIQKRVANLSKSPEFSNYSKIVIHVNDNTVVEAGDDSGRVLEFDNPFGTQALANQMLQKLRGFQYQPYEAKGAILDPAAEIGDAVSVHNVYGGIYKRARTFGRLMKADIAAPHDEEIDHEYKYESPTERKFTRQISDVRASILIQAGLIEAKVSKTSPTGQTSFSWAMNDTSHTWYANGNQVMKVSASGLEVNGKVTATSGFIGSGSNGFTISARAIYNGMASLGDTTHNGIYIGTDGIALGKGAFKVTSNGNVSANNMKLTGTLTIGGSTISANDLRLGAQRANSGYSSWNGTTNTVNSNGNYWSGGASYGYNYNNATVNGTSSYPGHFTAGYGHFSTVNVSGYAYLGNISFRGYSAYVTTVNGVRVIGLAYG